MMTITVDLNETQQAQIVYCKEMDRHLQIYILKQSDIDTQSQTAMDKINEIMKEVDSLKAVTDARDAVIKAAPAPVVVPPTPAVLAPTLTFGNGSGKAGDTVGLTMNFDPGPASVASLQFDVTIPGGISFVSATASAGTLAAGKSVATNMLNATTLRVLVFGLNQTTIGAGALLTIQMKIATGTPAGALNLPISGIVFSDPIGNTIAPGTATGSTITVSP